MQFDEKNTRFWRDWREFMASPEWHAIRLRAIEAAGGRCQRCGTSHDLQAHHRHYNKPFGEETNEDLEVLCVPCHRDAHDLPPTAPLWKRKQVHRQRLAYWDHKRAEKKAQAQAAKLL